MEKNFKTKYAFLYFALSLILFIAAYLIRTNTLKEPDYQKETDRFTKTLHKKEALLETLFERTLSDLKSPDINLAKTDGAYFENLFNENEIAIVVSKADSVVYWSTNSIPVEDIIVDTLYISEIFHLNNGWYEVREKRYKDYLIRGAILLKREYRYQNEYLANEFQKDFTLPNDCEIQLMEGEYNVFSSEGYLLCSLIFKNVKAQSVIKDNLAFAGFVLAFMCFLSFLVLTLKSITGRYRYKTLWVLLICLLIAVFRYFCFKLHFPEFVYSLGAFSPKYYANSDFFPSLGDLLLDVISIFVICLLLFRSFRRDIVNTARIHVILRIAASLSALIAIPFFFTIAFQVIKGLIINSSLSFDLNNIFNLDFYSFVGLMTVAFILLSFLLLTYILAEKALLLVNSRLKEYIILLLVAWIIYGLFNLIFAFIDWPYYGLIFALFLCIGFYLNRNKFRFTMQSIAVYIIFISILSTYCFYEYNTYKEREKRKLLASRLSIEQDPIAEYLFDKAEKQIISDTLIRHIMISEKDNKESLIKDIIEKKYLNGYWSRYNFQVTICPPGQILTIQPDNVKCDCDSFFMGMINSTGIATMNSGLYFLNNGSGTNSYIAKIPFNYSTNDSIPLSNLYLEMDSKFLDSEQGYPELLIDKNIKIDRDLYNYSYAKYKNNKLLMQYGKFYYSMNIAGYRPYMNKDYSFFDKDNYDHLFYKINASTGVIISKKKDTLLDIIAPFSYIFIFYCLYILVFLFFLRFPLKLGEFSFNFKTRIQISMVSVLVISFIIIGISTLYYITSLYNKKNLDNISEKAHSVLVEVEHKLGGVTQVTPGMKDDIAALLIKFSNVFFTDINLYTPGGILIASSRPQVFDEGMVSRKMNTKAFNELSSNGKTLYIHKENIGTLYYESAYVPFRNDNNDLIGYINLPYFAKQSELQKEISNFLIAFININVLLTALAIIIALLVSNYITRPMKLIKDKIGQIKLGRKNEKIAWDRNDEIGGLVRDYNRMIDELAESADLLAKSERESAWREMAKQVAHEIKNPLTPMKLGMQYLKKAWEEKTPDWSEKFDKFTQTMIEQIESLSRIASEFSDFAKMPRANNEDINIVELIESAIILYQDNKKMIRLVKPGNDPCTILADKTQMLRVFNNLLKNSVQAVHDKPDGKIEIELTRNADKITIRVWDNGVGISKEQSERIFSPNFTTKTGGMGLGLAMVKSIVEGYKGRIWFESEKGRGTNFFVELPANIQTDTH